jgi:hypothetical protein
MIFLKDPMTFDALPLHDATLSAICINWHAARCEIQLLPVGRLPLVLVFEGFTNIELQRRETWGPSSSVNSVKERDGQFEIELQSGDTIRVAAPRRAFLEEKATGDLLVSF